jgi:hypothetical protein
MGVVPAQGEDLVRLHGCVLERLRVRVQEQAEYDQYPATLNLYLRVISSVVPFGTLSTIP